MELEADQARTLFAEASRVADTALEVVGGAIVVTIPGGRGYAVERGVSGEIVRQVSVVIDDALGLQIADIASMGLNALPAPDRSLVMLHLEGGTGHLAVIVDPLRQLLSLSLMADDRCIALSAVQMTPQRTH